MAGDGLGGAVELGYSALTRRERVERIALAERDRRAGRIEVAIAALGEASEWPARAVLALARLPEFEAAETRQILEEGLDAWVAEVGLAAFDMPLETSAEESTEASTEASPNDLDRPIDHDELELAFAEARTQTDEMYSANHVAERVLMDEPVGLTELNSELIAPAEEFEAVAMDAAMIEDLAPSPSGPPQPDVLAILEQWLQNLEGSRVRRAQ